MEGYAKTHIFKARELVLLDRATIFVKRIRDREPEIRCHELARAVGRVLHLEVQDGYYGYVDHSWLWISHLEVGHSDRMGLPNILDVYSVGQLPVVRLVDCAHSQLPHAGFAYRPGVFRSDINESLVTKLVVGMTSRSKGKG